MAESPHKPEKLFVTLDWVRPPSVYRFMEREFVDRFFETGELQLSSFAKFSTHEDELRWDDAESQAKTFVFHAFPSGDTFRIGMIVGVDAYILCATASADTAPVWAEHGADAAIHVLDTTSFGNCVVHALWDRMDPEWFPMAEGYCTYDNGPAHMYWDTTVDGDLLKMKDLHSRQQALLNKARYVPYYRKLKKYSSQLEYRWVFSVAEQVTKPIVVSIPEARRFCRPYYPSEST